MVFNFRNVEQANENYTSIDCFSDPVYTVPEEFGTGLKFVLFRLFTYEFVLLGGLKFVRLRGSRVFTRPKRPNFSPVPNSSGTV
jgi:hypothetical protein